MNLDLKETQITLQLSKYRRNYVYSRRTGAVYPTDEECIIAEQMIREGLPLAAATALIRGGKHSKADVMHMSQDELCGIYGIGPGAVISIYRWVGKKYSKHDVYDTSPYQLVPDSEVERRVRRLGKYKTNKKLSEDQVAIFTRTEFALREGMSVKASGVFGKLDLNREKIIELDYPGLMKYRSLGKQTAEELCRWAGCPKLDDEVWRKSGLLPYKNRSKGDLIYSIIQARSHAVELEDKYRSVLRLKGMYNKQIKQSLERLTT